jgi:photoactive yellow protein
MSDAARDLYSFLRSKDFVSSDDEGDDDTSDSDADDADTSDAFGALQTVASFDPDDPNDPDAADDDPSPEASAEASAPDASAPDASQETSLPFDDDATGERLKELPPDALNDLGFGVIEVDDDGVVQFFNRYESEMSGVAPETAVGKNFFTEVAPCSNNRLFVGRFKKGLRQGELDERFTYTYTYKMSPTLVDVRLYRDEDGRNWILVRQR